MTATLAVRRERWPLKKPFVISRGTKVAADVVVAEIAADGVVGRGECVPYARYGETLESVEHALLALKDGVAAGLDRKALQARLPAGAARNALDCALWDLEAKRSGKRAWDVAGIPPPLPVVTAETIALDTVEAMAEQATLLAHRPLLKIKVDGEAVVERVAAVREAAPAARLIVDANESWTPDILMRCAGALADLAVDLIEQPLPAAGDGCLADVRLTVPLCADESVHTAADVARCRGLYQAVNVKLDKAGGLTAALALAEAARQAGLQVMVGCMVCTSLAVAPALLMASGAQFVDLDGPLWLVQDRSPGLAFDDGRIHPPPPALWG